MSTITGTVTVGVTLGQAGYTSPLTIATNGNVLNSTGAAIYASGSYANAVVVNSGMITGTYGIEFYGAGSIVNTGTITGNKTGVGLGAGGALDNMAGLIQGHFGVVFYGAGTIINSATISGTGGGFDFGIGILSGAGVAVQNTGLIKGGYGLEGAATLSNSGTILGTYGGGVVLSSGGNVDNTAAGLIQGESVPRFKESGNGVEIIQDGTVTNAGTIIGGYAAGVLLGQIGGVLTGTAAVTNSGTITGIYGVELFQGGKVDNTGLIEGSAGGVTIEGTYVAGRGMVAGPGTIIDSGTIGGASGIAIEFGGGNLLALENGYVLGGSVTGAGHSATLELLGSTGSVTVDFDKAGGGFTNFGTVAFGVAYGNDETLTITNIAALPATVTGFTQLGDIVDLTQIHPVGSNATLNGSDQLVVSNGHQLVSLQLDPSEDYAGVVWQTSPDGAGGTDVSAQPCFLRGTMILTPTGEVAVETLRIGDLVTTESGEARAIKWVGRRSYAARFALGQKHILAVCVTAGALADGVPTRDLWLSPNHALYLDGVLIEAHDLVNGASIVQPEATEAIEYFHVELDSHDVVVANGALAESYIDDDNRLLFHNAAEYWTLYPEEDAQVRYCAPRLAEGDAVERARVAIARRAGLPITIEERRQRRRQH